MPVIAVILLLISIGSALISLSRPSIPNEIEGLIVYDGLTSEVAEGPVEYDTIPPAGGPHAATSLECGVYFVPVEDEKAVAALATGAVWIAYHPEISESELSGLEDFGEGELDAFMAPYPGLPEPYVITAWGVQLYPDGPDDPRIASFLRDYKNNERAPSVDLPCHQNEPVP